MKRKGFTLIELMVTIAIVGLLASIILASVNTARKNAQDARIKSQLDQVRNAAAIFHDTNQTYGTVVPDISCGITDPGTCGCTGGPMTGTVFASPSLTSLVTSSNYPSGTVLNCNSEDSSYIMTASLINPVGSNYFWCIDSSGNSKFRNSAADTDAISC